MYPHCRRASSPTITSGARPLRLRVTVLIAILVVVSVTAAVEDAQAGGRAEEEPSRPAVRVAYAGEADAEENFAHALATELERAVEEGTGGRVGVSLFPEGQLGDPRERLEPGAAEAIIEIVDGDTLRTLLPPLAAADIPFLYAGRTAAGGIFEEGPFAERIRGELSDALGVALLAVVVTDGGGGVSNSVRPLRSPADFESVSFAVSSPGDAAVVEAFGAQAEIVQSGGPSGTAGPVLSGDADGWVGPADELVEVGLSEQLAYRTDLELRFSRLYVLAPEAWLAGLESEDATAVRQAARGAAESIRSAVDARLARRREALEAAGISVYEPSDAERSEFARLGRPAYIDRLEEEVGLEWIITALESSEE